MSEAGGTAALGGMSKSRNAVVSSLLVLVAVLSVGPTVAESSETALVVTQVLLRGAEPARPAAGGMLEAGCREGARIVLVRGERVERVLTEGFRSACDPDIAFDGRRMLFAAQQKPGGPWNIFERDLEGPGVRQITLGAGDDRHPVYQGSFYTIDSAEPWHKITFVSTRANEQNESGGFPSTSLYSSNADGSSLHRITFNPSSDTDPTVLPDGRLLFSSWQRSTLERGELGRIGLFTSQTDGLDYALFSADEGRRIKRMPCVTPDRSVVFVESDEPTPDGAGSLASVSLRRNLHSYRSITVPAAGLFHSPSSLPDGKILVSHREDDAGQYGIRRLDPASGDSEPIFDDPGYDDIQAQPVAPRTRPDGRSSVVSIQSSTGLLYSLNVYDSDLAGRGWVLPGQASRLRVLEGLPRAHGASHSADLARGPLLQRRFLGEIDIEEDGSFNIEVPANVPIELQLLDADGMALRSCSWIWVRNRESRGCIGCHEDGERTPENRFVSALARASTPLVLPPDKRRMVDFRRDVLPIISDNCATAACHGDASAAPFLGRVAPSAAGSDPGVHAAYDSLLVSSHLDGSDDGDGKYVHPGRARTSPLIWHLFGRDTSRPWDADHIGGSVVPVPVPETYRLTDEEKRTLVEWIDLGASWSGTQRRREAPGWGGSP